MNENIKSLGTWIHGIASTEHLDSSGERVKLDGINISSLPIDGLFNYEHESKNSSNIVGKIIIAKKIFNEKDCENKSQTYFYEKAGKKPYLYVLGILFDTFGHKGAQEIKAHMEFDKAMDKLKSNPLFENTRYIVGFSIEGGKLETSPNMVKKCIARKVSITNLPCNKVCSAEIFNDFNSLNINDLNQEKLISTYKKSEEEYFEKAVDFKNLYHPAKASSFNEQKKQKNLNSRDKYVQGIGKLKTDPSVPKKTQSEVFAKPNAPKSDMSSKASIKIPTGQEWKSKIDSQLKAPGLDLAPKTSLVEKPKANLDQNWKSKGKKFGKSSSFRKAIMAGTRDVLQKEKITKSILEDAFESYKNKDILVKYVQETYRLEKSKAIEISKAYAYKIMKKEEQSLDFLIKKEEEKKKEVKKKPNTYYKEHKLLASAPSLEEAAKLTSKFYGGVKTSLHDSDDGTYAVHNSSGPIGGTHVREHKGRYRFEMKPSEYK